MHMSDQIEEYVKAYVGLSMTSKIGQLIISLQDANYSSISFVVGRTGFPNVVRNDAKLGDAVLFETPDDGIVEVRFFHHQKINEPVFRIERVSPTKGIVGGLILSDLQNAPFDQSEIARIGQSISAIKEEVGQRHDLMRGEQIEFLANKLDELAAAATRMGRRDWINLAVGVLTNTIFGAALSSDAAKFLFQAAGAALSWLWGNTLQFIP
jgi:hypothetical protein